MGLTQTVAPALEPVSLSQAKEQTEYTDGDKDPYFSILIAAAREHVEDRTERQLMTATWAETFDRFPWSGSTLRLSKSPLASVTSIEYIDNDGATQTWDSDEYRVDTTDFQGRITEAFEKTYPDTRDITEAVTVTYVAGYGAAEDVPEKYRHAIRFLVAHWFEAREPVVMGTIVSPVPNTVNNLISLGKVVTAQ